MIIDAISDLHGHYPKLEGGDLLIVAGDLTSRDEGYEYYKFSQWLDSFTHWMPLPDKPKDCERENER